MKLPSEMPQNFQVDRVNGTMDCNSVPLKSSCTCLGMAAVVSRVHGAIILRNEAIL